ncbi:TonB-dependent receptor plug domain-containing protein [Rhodoferax saidenbachensis]|uniref:TonB-dependent receptor plug domain-containing protein n=1 Tax=Rhodoferax saidenbachensis TaxID=1484693 RepID=A0A1P8K8Q7_9BURK|nr:TonB-dependent receptor [Rhodoferax saidenbachensis]APW42397.1 hypothetical protein RS694_07480 [Rhodoferax saidenbachensis]
MYKKYLVGLLLVYGSLAGAQAQGSASALSEQDFLNEMPIVLSVSHLAQRLDEIPGAVTILDRDFIRKTGARDVTDVLRFVPGFQTTQSFEEEAPLATYHGRSDAWANRIQVLVDGRSVYSGHLFGSAGLGLQTLAIDDIERIEVLRGTNSAAYGARAFLGVVNIVSRDTRTTAGAAYSIAKGENGIDDIGLRVGWGESASMYRISADSREDNGLRGAFGKNRIGRFNFVTDGSLDPGLVYSFKMGGLEVAAGRGTVDDPGGGNLARFRFMDTAFVQLDVTKSVGEGEDYAFGISRTLINNNDHFPYQPAGGGGAFKNALIDFGAQETNDVVSLRRTLQHSATLRSVMGTELRRELIVSRSSFDTLGSVTSDFVRLFGNAEWRFAPSWLLNAGALAERSSLGGFNMAPRLMLNWQAMEGHTLRAGTSSGFRPPSAYEKFGARRYYDVTGALATTYYTLASGDLVPERIVARELGYLGELKSMRTSLDIRLFDEQISDGIQSSTGTPTDYGNFERSTITGGEYQLTWRPSPGTELFVSQTITTIDVQSSAGADARVRAIHGSPLSSSSMALLHQFSGGIHVALTYQNADVYALTSDNGGLYSRQRVDVRLARQFRVGRSKAELAWTLQNIDSPYLDSDKKFYFEPRSFVTLRIEN